MVFGDDVSKELFNKIGATGGEHPFELFKQAKNELSEGNHVRAKETFEQIVNITITNTERLLSQKQHRSAAEQFYIQARAYEMLENTEKRDEVLTKVVDSLLSASKTAIDFGENNRGITAHALAGIVCLTMGDEERAFAIYNEGTELTKEKPNMEALKKILFSLGYLLDALRNINIAALTDAQNYISTDLRPMLASSKMSGFEGLLDEIIGFTSNILETRIKLPNINIMTSYPKDLLFNTTYDILIEIDNSGEGDAKNVTYQLKMPDDLEIVSGKTSETVETLSAGSKLEKTISIRFMTADGYEEKRQITGNVTFVDMLNNNRKQILSPIDIEFRSVSKASEYHDNINAMISEYDAEVVTDTSALPKEVVSSVSLLNESIKAQLVEAVNHENFENTEYGLITLKTILDSAIALLGKPDESSKLMNEMVEMVDQAKKSVSEEITSKLNSEKDEALEAQITEHTTAITSLTERLNSEKEQELEKQKSWFNEETTRITEDNNKTINDIHQKNKAEKEAEISARAQEITEKYERRIKSITDENEGEINKLNKTTENKIKQQLQDKEFELAEKHKVEIQTKNDETEKAIREIQEEYASELKQGEEKLRKELVDKHQKEVDELNQQMNMQISQHSGHAEEEKETALKTLEAKLTQENQKEIDESERNAALQYEKKLEDREVEMKREFDSHLKQKNQEIEDLMEKIRSLESDN